MTGNPVSWFGIHAADLDRAKKFYETVFGETLQEVGGGGMRFMIFGADWAKYGVSGMLWSDGGAVPGYGGTTVFFNCTDCAETARAAVQPLIRTGPLKASAVFRRPCYASINIFCKTDISHAKTIIDMPAFTVCRLRQAGRYPAAGRIRCRLRRFRARTCRRVHGLSGISRNHTGRRRSDACGFVETV